jgi:hypothetical protein
MLEKIRKVGRGINCQMVLGVHTLKRKLSSWADVMLLRRDSSDLGLLVGMFPVGGGICLAQLNANAPASESKEVARHG